MTRGLAAACLCVEALLGCDARHDSTDAGASLDAASPPSDPAAVCDALAGLACDAWARCGCGDALGWWDLPACTSIVRVQCTGSIATAETAEAVARGELRFDATAALAALELAARAGSAGCDPVTVDVGPILTGTRVGVEACAQLADVVDSCGDELACRTGRCVPRSLGIEGAPCPCVAGLRCDASTARGGVCAATQVSGPRAAGEACAAAADCESLLCIERCTPASCRWTLRGDGDAWLVLPGP